MEYNGYGVEILVRGKSAADRTAIYTISDSGGHVVMSIVSVECFATPEEARLHAEMAAFKWIDKQTGSPAGATSE